MHENSFLKNKQLHQARLEQEKKNSETLGHDTNQQQLGKTRFQDIADERYQSKLTELRGAKVDTDSMMESAKATKRKMDVLRDMSFNKKWGK